MAGVALLLRVTINRIHISRIPYQGVVGSTFYWAESDDLVLEEKVSDSSKMMERDRHWVPEMDAIIFTVGAVDTSGYATPQVFYIIPTQRFLNN